VPRANLVIMGSASPMHNAVAAIVTGRHSLNVGIVDELWLVL